MTHHSYLTQKVLVAYVVQDTKWLQQIETVLTEIFIHWKKWNVADGPLPSHADLILLLVSADLMDALTTEQQEQLRDRHQNGVCYCVGIMLCPTFWYQRPLEVIPVLPDIFGRVKPLAEWKGGNLPYALKQVKQGLWKILEDLEQVQLDKMIEYLQEVSEADHHRLDELITQGLVERLFLMCERLQIEEAEMVAPIYVQLATVTRERDPQFAKRCLQRAEALGHRAKLPRQSYHPHPPE